MAILCQVSGLALGSDGRPSPGKTINISRYGEVSQCGDNGFPTQATSGADGTFKFIVPQGSRVELASSDLGGADGYRFTAPMSETFNLGNFAEVEL